MAFLGLSFVIASAAKQSIFRHGERMDCFAALAMTWSSAVGRQQWLSRTSSGPSFDSGEGICGCCGWEGRRSGGDLRPVAAGLSEGCSRAMSSYSFFVHDNIFADVAFLRPDARPDVPALIRIHAAAPDPPQNARCRAAPRNDRVRR